MSEEICLMCSDTLEKESLLCERCEKESELKEWVEDRQLNGDDGSGFNDYEQESDN